MEEKTMKYIKELKAQEIAALKNNDDQKADSIFEELWRVVQEQYKAKFGYETDGDKCGFCTRLDILEGIEEAIKTGEPCMNETEEEQIRAFYKRQGKKVPKDYEDMFKIRPGEICY